MAAEKQSDELKQAIRLLKLLSKTQQEAVVHLIRVMAESADEDDDTAFLEAHPDWVGEDMKAVARIEAGDYSQTVPAEQLRRELGLPARKSAAHA